MKPATPRAIRATGLALAALTLALASSGCADGLGGAAAYVGSIGGASSLPARPSAVQIFVASARAGESGSAAQQESEDGLHYSLVTMTIPPGHQAGAIEAPLWGSPDARKHIVVAGRRELDPDEFRAELTSHLSGRIGVNRDVLVFVHGYNNSFEEARLRAAQIVADSRFGGVAVMFTWPSRHELLGYGSDKDSAMAARDSLQAFLEDVAKTPGIGKIDVLGHSMGAWLTMESLRQSALAGNRDLGGKLGEVMLASPDIDMEVFAKQVARIEPADVTVFASANDRALSLSSALASSRQRVGAIDASRPADRDALERLGVKVYDLSGFSDGLIGHAIYADAPEVIRSIGAQLAAPRAQEVNTMSIIDARGDAGPDPAPAPARRSE